MDLLTGVLAMIVNFVAPGGAGKSAIINALISDDSQSFSTPVSYTSRAPRKGERDGVDYYFKTKEQILCLADKIAVHQTSAGIVYANRISTFLDSRKVLLTTLRPQGVLELEQFVPNILVLNLTVCLDERMRRMRERGDAECDIQDRIRRDESELESLRTIQMRSKQVWIDCSRPLIEVVREVRAVISLHIIDNR